MPENSKNEEIGCSWPIPAILFISDDFIVFPCFF